MRLRLFKVYAMALSERQQKAEALKNEIHQLGGFVVNPMPLGLGEKLRFQFLTGLQCEAALDRLRDLGFEPMFRNAGLRFCLNGVAEPCNTYEIGIAADTPKVLDDRTIKDTRLASTAKDAELEAMRKTLGLK